MDRIAIYDVETTGLDPKRDHIVQLSAVKLGKKNMMKIIDKFDAYVIPAGEWNMSPAAQEVTGLSKEFILAHGRPTKEVLMEFNDWIADSDLGGYNSNRFDIKFLYNESQACGLGFDMKGRKFYDVLAMECRIHPRNLGAIYKNYTGKTMEDSGLDAHNSLSDTTATAVVMAHQMMQENLNWEDIDTWQENQIISPEGSIRNTSMEGHEPRLVMAFGKWKDQDIYEMAQSPEGISYLSWAKENVFSIYTLQVIAEYFKMRKYGRSSDHTINK